MNFAIRNTLIFFVLSVGTCLTPFISTPAYAHRVTIFAWVEDGQVLTQSKFGAGAKVNSGKVSVYDSNGKELLSGQTDAKGEFSFPIPAKSDLRIVLDATMGHRAEWTVPSSELTEQPDNSPQPPAISETAQATVPHQENLQNSSQLETTIEKVLDRKLKPIHHLLLEMNQPGPSLHDIIAGLGYIAGLFGVAAWVQARKQRP